MRQAEAIKDGNRVRHALTAVQHQARCAPLAQQREDTLDGDVQRGDSKVLKHDLHHLLAVGLGVVGWLCEQHGMALRVHLQLIEESVLPQLLHLIEVLDDAVLQRIGDGELVAEIVDFIPEVDILVQLRLPDPARRADLLRKDGLGRLIAREAGLADARAIVDDNNHLLIYSVILDVGILLARCGAIGHSCPSGRTSTPRCTGEGARKWGSQ
mmetsp:Transcript_78987/g.209749  ORF Transcript_78987/g.209749 Transcript_78987/m.209749 type:complete len:212 (+) Transcript_78987:688-1323(+)